MECSDWKLFVWIQIRRRLVNQWFDFDWLLNRKVKIFESKQLFKTEAINELEKFTNCENFCCKSSFSGVHSMESIEDSPLSGLVYGGQPVGLDWSWKFGYSKDSPRKYLAQNTSRFACRRIEWSRGLTMDFGNWLGWVIQLTCQPMSRQVADRWKVVTSGAH